ncbi:nucleotide pyrophosphohydrolase [Streptomyces sp. SP18ES09]|uniref:nucleotide pyrophosphohydrolase n=1 Tax=Streptomyces sp. SP18ES09 TaxID=3002532 RepID=UPI002E78A520|nr:nucleotide pyrophosphohydrolase [Streptomyces sp. SP18ES09]MEE1819517.1 nucleotide pyrophosphohydrolase [Streptomyces sp. SP18ES09]
MTDNKDVAGLQRRLVEFAAARDWQPYHTPKNLAAALSVEAAELLEIFQWLTPEQAERVMEDPEKAHRVADEVADVLAYLLQFCQVVGVDPLAALAAKIDRNELRFPARRRGGGADGVGDGGARGVRDGGAEGGGSAEGAARGAVQGVESEDRHSSE